MSRTEPAHTVAAIVLGIQLMVPAAMYSQSADPSSATAERLVEELRQFPASLPGIAPSTGVLPATEQQRRTIYDQLWKLGAQAIPALNRGLADPDVQIRRNVALFLNVAGGRLVRIYETSHGHSGVSLRAHCGTG
jgi:hypothetical protein